MAIKLLATGTTEDIRPAKGESFTLQELQHEVGGYIEILRTPGRRLLVFDEEGKLKGKPRNERATSIALSCGCMLNDYIAGDCLWVTQAEMGD